MPSEALSQVPADSGRDGRIPLPSIDQLTSEQRKVYDEVVNGPRGRMVGPLRAVIHNPELALRWSRLGEFLRYKTSIPPRQGELAIVITSRRWTSQVEWAIHSRIALAEGLPKEVIEAIRDGKPPVFDNADDAAVYEYVRQLQQSGHVEVDIYQRVSARWGDSGVVELTGIVGYYTMVAMTLNAHLVPLPDDETSTLTGTVGEGLHMLPKAIEAFRG